MFAVFISKNVLTKHKEVYLSINGTKSVRLEKGAIKFKNYFKKIPVPFNVYADFECNINSAESYEGSLLKKISRSHSLQFCSQACLCWWWIYKANNCF